MHSNSPLPCALSPVLPSNKHQPLLTPIFGAVVRGTLNGYLKGASLVLVASVSRLPRSWPPRAHLKPPWMSLTDLQGRLKPVDMAVGAQATYTSGSYRNYGFWNLLYLGPENENVGSVHMWSLGPGRSRTIVGCDGKHAMQSEPQVQAEA